MVRCIVVLTQQVDWSMWSVIVAIATLTLLLGGLIVRLTRNHTRLEEGHKHHIETTKDKFSAVHHRIDGKADDKIVGSIDAKLDIIIEKLM